MSGLNPNIIMNLIPNGWEVIALKYVVDYNKDTLSEDTAPCFEFDYVDIGSVTYGKGIEQFQRMVFREAPSRARRKVKTNDVILSTVRTYLKAVASIPERDVQVVVSTGFLAMSAKKRVVPRFLFYAVQSDYFVDTIEANSYGISYPAINSSTAVSCKILLPPLEEQQAIASYLDDRCAKLDEIITEAEKSIEEYKEYRESVISNATTRGIRNNTMKESGIPWIPLIPENWYPISAKALFTQRKERAVSGERQLTASQNLGIIYQDDYMRIQGTRLMVVQKDFDILKHVEPDDFVISMRSFQGGLEYSYLRGCISSAYVMLIPNHEYVFSEYYKWLFKSDKYINALQSTSDLIRDGQALRYANFVKLRLFTVPIEEQQEIAEYLNEEIPRIDALISEKQSLIEDLKAYKKSLIYEVVTGKRRVV